MLLKLNNYPVSEATKKRAMLNPFIELLNKCWRKIIAKRKKSSLKSSPESKSLAKNY